MDVCSLVGSPKKSMLGHHMLVMCDQRLRQVTGRDEVFGGVSIILLGDWKQIPPVGDTALYRGDGNTATQARGELYMASLF